MKVASPIADKILARLQSHAHAVVPAHDFLDLGNRAAVDQALSRLVRQGTIRRVQRGLYELPRFSRLLRDPMVQSPDQLIQAWARKNGLRVAPSGASAANLLGLSTQVPAKIVFYTNGRTRTLKLGPYTVRLLNRGPRTMDVAGKVAPLVLEALRHLGRRGVTPQVVARLRTTLSDGNKAELRGNLSFAPAWMVPVIQRIVGPEDA